VEGLAERTAEAGAAVRSRWPGRPTLALVLGSGLGPVADTMELEAEIAYDEVPHLPVPTALSHRGRLLCGRLAGLPAVAFQGRLHLYEGHALAEATLPVRLAAALGATVLALTNAAGGLDPRYLVGDLVVLDDHIHLLFANPLTGPDDDRCKPRSPGMCRPYDRELAALALAAGGGAGLRIWSGVYAAVSGPSYETRAERRMLRRLGADLVGMSTVPEAIVAAHAGLRTLALSVVTNRALPDAPEVDDADAVVAAAGAAAAAVRTVLLDVAAALCRTEAGG
jgi:purine-nucleoside phosphorylase